MRVLSSVKVATALVVCGLVFAVLRADLSPAAEAGSPTEKLTLFHWWTSPSETAAVNALIALFGKKYPEVTLLATVIPEHRDGNSGLFAVVRSGVQAQRPPDTFQMIAGYASKPFFDAGLLSPIDELWRSEKLEGVIPPFIAEMSKFNGHYYSVPIGAHRMNVVWCNKPLLDKYQIKSSTLTTWDAFFKAAETLKAGGIRYPIQMGESWTASHVFQCIVASLGIATYEDWINGKITNADDPRLLKALGILKMYLSYVNKDHANISWDKAVQRVTTGEGAFCTMGDWANGEFKIAGQKLDKEYEAIPVPGTKGLYGVTVDAFLHPRALANETNSDRWLKMIASREGQDTFNPLKGSISVRYDADVSKYDAYQRSAIADMKAANVYPAIGQGAPAHFGDLLDHILATFATDQDAGKAATALADATVGLKTQYTRVWSLARARR